MYPGQTPLLFECIKASFLLVLIANICARIQSRKARWGWFLGLSFLSYLFTFAVWPVSLTALLMISLMVLWTFYQQRLPYKITSSGQGMLAFLESLKMDDDRWPWIYGNTVPNPFKRK